MIAINKVFKWLSEVWNDFWLFFLDAIVRSLELEDVEPNKVTMVRIWSCPILFVSILLTFHAPIFIVLDFIVWIIGAITDGLDGHLARHYAKNRSPKTCRLGKCLDSAADKLMIFSVFSAVQLKHSVLDYRLFLCLAVLETILFGFGLYVFKKGEKWEKDNNVGLGSNKHGKRKFAAEIICGIFIFLFIISHDRITYWCIQVFCSLAITFAALSIYRHRHPKKRT